ncbi:MAG: type II toxin-antitoxin system Phd/YefM family antitoxin [Oscillospiraceae bacterium]|nr:type II toxin-antitoxin system Phd/YefM family antitoxin [Oscillospiraceae bacterium]
MEFLTVRDFRASSKNVWDKLAQTGEIVVTNNGKPTALMLNIENGNFDELSRAIRQAKAMIALNSIREEAAERGFLSDDEIEAEIQAYRQEKRDKK